MAFNITLWLFHFLFNLLCNLYLDAEIVSKIHSDA